MTFDHEFGYSIPLFSSLLKKREEEKENELSKIAIKGHAFLLDLNKKRLGQMIYMLYMIMNRYGLNIFDYWVENKADLITKSSFARRFFFIFKMIG